MRCCALYLWLKHSDFLAIAEQTSPSIKALSLIPSSKAIRLGWVRVWGEPSWDSWSTLLCLHVYIFWFSCLYLNPWACPSHFLPIMFKRRRKRGQLGGGLEPVLVNPPHSFSRCFKNQKRAKTKQKAYFFFFPMIFMYSKGDLWRFCKDKVNLWMGSGLKDIQKRIILALLFKYQVTIYVSQLPMLPLCDKSFQ